MKICKSFPCFLVICFTFYLNLTQAQQQQQPQHEECAFENCICGLSFDLKGYDIECRGDVSGTVKPNYFPKRNPSSTMRSITNLNIYNFDFKAIPNNTFENLEIKKLLLSNNNLESIDTFAFNGIVSLKQFTLFEDNLKSIGLNALSFLSTSLEDLTLTINKNVTLDFANELIYEIQVLKYLNNLWLNLNGLHYIKPDWLSTFSNLISLVSNTKTSTFLHPNVFKNNQKLLSLDLSNNQYSVVDMVFIALEPVANNLRYLYLASNSIEHVEAFPPYNSLTDLDLSFNRIKIITPATFGNLKNLRNLILSRNQLKTVEDSSFLSLNSLFFLNLASNYLNRIPNIKNLTNLAMLDISNQNEQLKSINSYAFERVENRYASFYLNLDGNSIDSFGNRSFCSNYQNSIRFGNLEITAHSLTNLHRCMLTQFKSDIPDVKPIIQVTNFTEKYNNLCSCSFRSFVRSLNIEFKIDCTNPCEINEHFESCSNQGQYLCHLVTPTTVPTTSTHPPTTTTTQTTTTSEHKSTEELINATLQSLKVIMYTLVDWTKSLCRSCKAANL